VFTAASNTKPMSKTIRIPITNVFMDGDYTGTILLGSKQKPANVILDTGSSTLSVDGKKYDPTRDSEAKITNIAQEVGYGDGSNWIGAVVQTDVRLGTGAQAAILPKANVAVAY